MNPEPNRSLVARVVVWLTGSLAREPGHWLKDREKRRADSVGLSVACSCITTKVDARVPVDITEITHVIHTDNIQSPHSASLQNSLLFLANMNLKKHRAPWRSSQPSQTIVTTTPTSMGPLVIAPVRWRYPRTIHLTPERRQRWAYREHFFSRRTTTTACSI